MAPFVSTFLWSTYLATFLFWSSLAVDARDPEALVGGAFFEIVTALGAMTALALSDRRARSTTAVSTGTLLSCLVAALYLVAWADSLSRAAEPSVCTEVCVFPVDHWLLIVAMGSISLWKLITHRR